MDMRIDINISQFASQQLALVGKHAICALKSLRWSVHIDMHTCGNNVIPRMHA